MSIFKIETCSPSIGEHLYKKIGECSPLLGEHKRALFYLKKMHFPNKGGHTSYSLIFLSEGKPLTVCFPIQYLFTVSEENSISVVFGYHIFMCSFVYHIAMT